MKTRQFGFAATVIALGAIAMSTACGDQPDPKCVTGRGEFAARYTKTAGTKPFCDKKGELFGVQSYNALGDNGAPNLDKVPIAIQPVRVVHFANLGNGDPTAAHTLYAKGIFKTPEPDGNGICEVDMTTTTDQVFAAVKDSGLKVATLSDPKDPNSPTVCADAKTGAVVWGERGTVAELGTDAEAKEITVKYEWSAVKFYVTASATGTQFMGHLKYTQNGDSCEWDVHGMYPSVSCGTKTGIQADNTISGTADPTCRTTTATPVLCQQDAPADLVYGATVGSSINPDFKRTCEPFEDVDVHDTSPSQFVCLPDAQKFPSLN